MRLVFTYMPGRNVIKLYESDSYYHVYNRGVDRKLIFKDSQDYTIFLYLLKRYLGKEVQKNSFGVAYPNYFGEAELLSYCLMPNHFHLLIFQTYPRSIEMVMKSVGISYGMYFNKRYSRVGPVWQNRYRASKIDSVEYLLNITAYIHLNPDNYLRWQWSSLPYYLGDYKADWIIPERILALFTGTDYLNYLKEIYKQKQSIKNIEQHLANANLE